MPDIVPDPALLSLAPPVLLAVAALLALAAPLSLGRLWRVFVTLAAVALVASIPPVFAGSDDVMPGLLRSTPLALGLAVLVQLLGLVLAAFSSRYLEGEPNQPRFIAALAGVLGSVHVLLLADHWLVLIAAWALVGVMLRHLLCFYGDRSFARLAAHKKRLADRAADVLLLVAAMLAWREVGSGNLGDLGAHLAQHGTSLPLQMSALALVGAVILRTALLPVHGWLIQVMEAPTPVSALLHAGVVNLGGFVLIRFAPLLDDALVARSVLVVAGLATAILAGMVMLSRVTIKVRLAWSTTAQMGFMVMQCGLGLHTLAALHLIGHALYKAHTFLAASDIVRQTRLRRMRAPVMPTLSSLLLAPVLAVALVWGLQHAAAVAAWPIWWVLILGLAWAPLLWQTTASTGMRASLLQGAWRIALVAGLTVIALLAHGLPLATTDQPHEVLGWIAATGLVGLYAAVVVLQRHPNRLQAWRRWSYAGFYIDEIYTRLALGVWPTAWGVDRPGPVLGVANTAHRSIE